MSHSAAGTYRTPAGALKGWLRPCLQLRPAASADRSKVARITVLAPSDVESTNTWYDCCTCTTTVRVQSAVQIYTAATLSLRPLPRNTPGLSHSEVSELSAAYKCKHANLAGNGHLVPVRCCTLAQAHRSIASDRVNRAPRHLRRVGALVPMLDGCYHRLQTVRGNPQQQQNTKITSIAHMLIVNLLKVS